MTLKEIRGKKANTQRWEALKMLDWGEDQEIIKAIFEITNPLFFSSRTPKEIIQKVREDTDYDNFTEEYLRQHKKEIV